MKIHLYLSDQILTAPGIVRLPKEMRTLTHKRLGVPLEQISVKLYDEVAQMPQNIIEAYDQAGFTDDVMPIVFMLTMHYTPEREAQEQSLAFELIDQASAHADTGETTPVMGGLFFYDSGE